jgi:molecular chaperone GrpE
MNPNNNSNEEIIEEFDLDNQSSSVDDFLKELEEKEKVLDISSDLVIEVGDSEVEHDNIHESFIPSNSKSQINITGSLIDQTPGFEQHSANQKDQIPELKKQISELMAERDDFINRLGRRQKEFDNYRNRTERERKDIFKNVLSKLATQVLPVMDNMNRALDSATNAPNNDEQDFQNFLEGIVLVNQQLNEVLAGMGVQPISALGKSFDPNFHEAVASEETDKIPPRTVIQELLKGYRLDDKVIRPSMVKVSVAPRKEIPSSEDKV